MKLRAPARDTLVVRFRFNGETFTRTVRADSRETAARVLAYRLLVPADRITILSAHDSCGSLR